jgi:hypothetical protein
MGTISIFKNVSLEDLVRRDIEKWLRETDTAVTNLERLSDADRAERERLIRGVMACGKKYREGVMAMLKERREELALTPEAAEAALLHYLPLVTSAEFQRRIADLGRAFLAANMLADAYELYSGWSSLTRGINHLLDTPDAIRGTTNIHGAKAGHEAVHGDDTEKRERWRRIHDDYKNERAKATPKATSVVAQRYNVSERTVYRARKNFSEID